jgi:hypothetical protein
LSSQSILDKIETEDTFYPGHTRYYHLDELCKYLENIGFNILHRANVNYLSAFSHYRNKNFGWIKNMLVKSVPIRYSTHIEIVALKQ